MKILITGATGLVGTALVRALADEGHTVCRLVRPSSKTEGGTKGAFDVPWNPETGELGGAAVGGDAVVNLAGASVADGRWTEKRKKVLRGSRVDSTQALIDALGKMNAKPAVLVNASAIGYYGNRGDEILDESSAAGRDFLAELAKDWEAEARRAEAWRTRVVLARFGIILARDGGALAKMIQPFRFGLGGKIASGKQWMSWVALEDVVEILKRALTDATMRGAINVVAPEPVTNAEFTKELAKAVGKPAVLTVPGFTLKLAMGSEMAEAMLLTSQRVVPGALARLGYRFKQPELAQALEKLVGG